MFIKHLIIVRLAGAALMLGPADAEALGPGRGCGGASNIACGDGLWCEPQATRCGGPSAPGRCVTVPEVCTMIYQPVCGCDANTYSNDCVRRSKRVGKRHDGEC